MTAIEYVTKLAIAADSTVTGVAQLQPGQVPGSGWTVVTNTATGIQFRIDAIPGPPNPASQTAVINADLSDANLNTQTDAQQPDKATLRNTATQMVSDINSYLAAADNGTTAQIQARDHTALKGLALDMKRVLNYLLTQVS